MIGFKLEAKETTPKEIPKIGISNPKRYDEHAYHFTIYKNPLPLPPPGNDISSKLGKCNKTHSNYQQLYAVMRNRNSR